MVRSRSNNNARWRLFSRTTSATTRRSLTVGNATMNLFGMLKSAPEIRVAFVKEQFAFSENGSSYDKGR